MNSFKKQGLDPSQITISDRKIGIYHIWLGLIGLAFIVLAGCFFTTSTVRQVDISERNKYIKTAQIAAVSISADQIKQLSGSLEDLDTPDYQDIKKQLVDFGDVDQDASYFYLLGKSEDQIIFFADSTSTDSSDYSPPGQVYSEASPQIHQIFEDELPITEGPSRDRWGVWISALVPIKDPADGRVLGVFGFDIPESAWRERISTAQHEPILITEADKIRLFSKLGNALNPEGALIIGSTESLTGLCPQFESMRYLRSVYYRLR